MIMIMCIICNNQKSLDKFFNTITGIQKMKRNNIMALGALLMGASAATFADVESEEIKPKIEFSGLVEVDYAENALDNNKKVLSVDKVEFGITANINQDFNANIVFLSEPKEANIDLELGNPVVDEATLNGKISDIDFTLGKLTVPFGMYETALISDPAGKDIGETGGVKALVISTEINGVTLSAWTGNSKNNGFSVNYQGENFSVGVDTIRDTATDSKTTDIINNKGVAINGQASFGNTTIIVEQIKVDGDTATDENGKLTQLELNHTIGDDWVLAVSSNKGTSTGGAKNDTKTIAYGVTYAMAEGVSLALESSKAKDESSKISAQLAYEF